MASETLPRLRPPGSFFSTCSAGLESSAPFQIREIEIDANDKVVGEVVLTRTFDGMDDARHEIAALLSSENHAGYEPEHGYWSVRNNDGKRFDI